MKHNLKNRPWFQIDENIEHPRTMEGLHTSFDKLIECQKWFEAFEKELREEIKKYHSTCAIIHCPELRRIKEILGDS
jgi:hypothetical protein